MNYDVIDRLRKAHEYQMLAVKALLPERAVTHLDVIEKELTAMIMECLCDPTENKSNEQSKKGAQKIDIE